MIIDIIITDSRWRSSYRDVRADVTHAVALLLRQQKKAKASVTILFTNDAEQQQLNHQYRSKNAPTNVLSFPSGEEGFLGDISLAYETVKREKTSQNKSWRAHTLHLVLHGVLHLLGHDHEENADAEKMESLEIQLLNELGLANPYK
jgi:probable rRNA maturation factor